MAPSPMDFEKFSYECCTGSIIPLKSGRKPTSLSLSQRPSHPVQTTMASSSRNPSHIPLHRSDNSTVGGSCGQFSNDHRKTCLCSPTTHPGSFRCNLHKASPSLLIKPRKPAITDSIAGIGSANGEWVKRVLRTIILPSSLHKRRCEGFRPRPSRLSIMSKAEDL